MEVVTLGAEDLAEAIDVLSDAFSADPLMHYLFEGEPMGTASLAGYACAWRLAVGWPVLGVRGDDGSLLGVASLSRPGESPIPEASDAAESIFRESVSPGAWQRYLAYVNASSIGVPGGRCHYLGMIGVLTGVQGTGVGKELIEAVHTLSDEDPQSQGVWLDTERSENVRWYERQGYRILAVNALGPLAVTLMFRQRRSTDASGTPA
ncbi:MAG: GNAT family N-acetyltransferase [Gemmatimonadota bacterium]